MALRQALGENGDERKHEELGDGNGDFGQREKSGAAKGENEDEGAIL